MKIQLLLPVLAALLATSCKTTPPSRFALADTNADGVLSRAEMSDYLVDSVFIPLDTNNDGKMSMAEWNPDNRPSAVQAFKERDTNKDGFVTLQEARDFGRKSKANDAIFREADTNKDNVLSFAEVTAYYASKEGPAR